MFEAAKLRWFDQVTYLCECAPKYSLREYFWLGIHQRKLLREADVYHSPHFTLPYFLGLPSVVTIHDVIHYSHPESFYHRPIAQKMIRSALRRADHIITVSEDSARHIRGLADNLKAPVSVIPNSLRPNLERKSAEDVSQFLRREFATHEYCLYVGSERAHKGFPELLDAWIELSKDKTLERCPDLIVVGKQFTAARDRVQELKLDGVVRFFGEVSLDKLAMLYSGASAVVVPSKVEGFGLPALEGMGMGVPVICAPIPSLREVCDDAAIYAEDNSGHSLANAVRRLMQNDQLAAQKVQLGLRRAQQFSIEECALKTWHVYEQVLGRPRFQPKDSNDGINRRLSPSV